MKEAGVAWIGTTGGGRKRWFGSLFVVVAFGGVLFASCAGDPPDTVASMKGWRLLEADLEREFERKSPGSYASSTPAQKEELATTILNKEVLLRIAREACPTPDWKRSRSVKLSYEKRLVDDYLKDRQKRFRLSDADLRLRLDRVSRVGHARVVYIRRDAIQQAAEAVRSGVSIEQIAARFGAVSGMGTQPSGVQKMELKALTTPPLFLAGTLIRDQAAGTTSHPIETQQGVVVVHIDRYEPLDLSTLGGGGEPRVRAMLNELAYMPANQVYVDSLKRAVGLAWHSENDSIVMHHFQAYWDSIEAAQPERVVDFQALKAPVWLFTSTEQARPLYDLYGKTHSVGDFVRTLNAIDLDNWPTIGSPPDPVAKIRFQIQSRVMRLMYQTEAEHAGLPERPEFVERMRRLEEVGLLDQWRETVLLAKYQPSATEVQEEYQKNGVRYMSPEQVVFGVLTFPPEDRARADATLAALQAGDPVLWYELGAAEAKRDPRVRFLPDTNAPVGANGNGLPDPTLKPFLDVALRLESGQVSPILESPAGTALVRVSRHDRPTPVPFAEVERTVRMNLINARADAAIEQAVVGAQKRWGAKVHSDRLGVVTPSAN